MLQLRVTEAPADHLRSIRSNVTLGILSWALLGGAGWHGTGLYEAAATRPLIYVAFIGNLARVRRRAALHPPPKGNTGWLPVPPQTSLRRRRVSAYIAVAHSRD